MEGTRTSFADILTPWTAAAIIVAGLGAGVATLSAGWGIGPAAVALWAGTLTVFSQRATYVAGLYAGRLENHHRS